jgi:hypothetical protein
MNMSVSVKETEVAETAKQNTVAETIVEQVVPVPTGPKDPYAK